jgi:hypothetical protein
MSDQKSSEDRKVDTFLDDAHKKSVSNGIRQRNREKKLRKVGQASLNQDQESDSGCSTSENPVAEISAGGPCQNSHRKKGAESIVQMIADGIKNNAQSSDKTIPCDEISAGAPAKILPQFHCFL